MIHRWRPRWRVFLRAAAVILLGSSPLVAGPSLAQSGGAENIAFGKKYILRPAPNYPLTQCPDDMKQLTDGVFTKGHFWTQKSTVGWQHLARGQTVDVIVDLGKVEPIGKVGISVGGDGGAVKFPKAIHAMVSMDANEWYVLGEITAPYRKDMRGHKAVLCEITARTKGRYVRFRVTPDENLPNFVFTDEVVVYRGDEALLAEDYAPGTRFVRELTPEQRKRQAAFLRNKYENIALGKPYTLRPEPNYQYTKNDPLKHKRLTDGEYTDSTDEKYWVQPSTVGWSAEEVEITLDLGEHRAIRGFGVNTVHAPGTDVVMPASTEVLVSVDGRRFHMVGDLVKMSKPLPGVFPHVVRFETGDAMTHGRYVKFIVHKGGRLFIFIDEVEVYRGEDPWILERPLPSEDVREYGKALMESPFSAAVKARLEKDLRDVRAELETSPLAVEAKRPLLSDVEGLFKEIDDLPEYKMTPDFKFTYPLNAIHARTFQIRGKLRTAEDKPPLAVWTSNPWDFVSPADEPKAGTPPRIEVAAMRGETRSGALNLTNATERDITVNLRLEGLPGGDNPPCVKVRCVEWTDTWARQTIGAALPLAAGGGRSFLVDVPGGMMRQVWFEVTPARAAPAGRHEGAVVVSASGQPQTRVPFVLRVFDLDFPEKTTLRLAGWDYTDRPSSSTSYGVTHENVEAFIAHLKARCVTGTWASTWVMPQGTFNADGIYAQTPDTKLFDEWIARWPEADGFYVYVNATFWENRMGGSAPGEPLFEKKVGEWARFWAGHARKRGALGRLWIVPVDEPHEKASHLDPIFCAWSRAIKAAEPELKTWVNPYYADPSKMSAEMLRLADAVCPLWGQMLRADKTHEMFWRRLQRTGKRLEFYIIANVLSDPYANYRLPAWWAFDMGAQAISFWAFGSAGGGEGDSWNQFAARYTAYAPLFLRRDSVTPGKHMESIVEGVQDFEYLVMLRDRVKALAGAGDGSPLIAQARTLLAGAAQRVIRAEGVKELDWKAPKDRSLADAVRLEIGEMLERLKGK